MLPFFAFVLLTVGQKVAVAEQPIVNLIREVIYEADQYLATNHLDQQKLPNLGVLPLDPFKLRNGRVGNFSTITLIGEPYVVQSEAADGSTSLSLDLEIGLKEVLVYYDVEFALQEVNGSASISTNTDSVHANVTVTLTSDQKCKAVLYTAEVLAFQDFAIEIKPEDIPNLTKFNQKILNLVVPALLPFTNTIVSGVISTELFQNKFSEIVCKKFGV